MLPDKHQEQIIIDHCWHIYDLITNTFHVAEDFHAEYIAAIESVLLTNRLYFKVTIEQDEYHLIIQEDFEFHFYELPIVNYSYILTDKKITQLSGQIQPHIIKQTIVVKN